MKGKSLIGVILAAICVTVTYLLPGSEELSHEGITALGVLGMASILWISNTLPFGVTGLLALVMLVLLGVSDMASVFVGFSNSSVIFVITVFCLTAAVMNTKLTLRLINKLLRWAGSSAEKLVLAYMAAAALLSSVMSNVPVTVLFLGLAQPVLKAVGAKPGSSRLGKCLMIGIPFAAVNGGMATPAGSSFNVLAMGVFESIAGKPLTFLQWMAVGLPTAIVATLVCWICLVKIFKPEAINEECSASIREEAENAGKISAYEKKVLFMLVAMPVLWILGTWFPALDVTVVSIIGFVVMFMPGINILTWKQFEESVPWNIILMFGAILSLGTIVAKTGGAAYLSKLFLASGVMNLNIILVFFIVGVFAYLLQTFFPVAPAIISLFVPAVAAVCVPMGISAAVPTLIITIVAAGTYLLPINPISALSFDYGYYSSADMAKAGLVPSVAQFDTVTVKDVLHKYTKNPLACSCIWMVCAVYTCLPYWEASAGEFMRCLRWESAARASGYPEGGCQAITDTYSKAFTKLGGEIMLNAPVEKAVVKDGKVVGVIVNGEEIDCDMMVYNGDIKTAVNKVIGAEHFDKEYVDYVNALKYSWGGTTVKLAVDGHLTDLKMLSQFGTLDQEKFYEDLAKGIIPEEVNFFMSNPSNYSKSAAPEGKQMICFTCPHQLDLPEEIEARLVDKMMVTAEKYIPGLSEHIIIKEVLFNSDIMTASGKGGAGIGIGQVAGQTGAYRPKIKLPVEGAYVVGAAAGGAGVGTELAVNSAIEFFDNYCK